MKKNLKYILFSLISFSFIGKISAACVSCGPDTLAIPEAIPSFVSKLVTIVQIMVPVILIVVGMINYTKAVASGEDKVIKETNSSFIRSIITGVSIFLLVAIVRLAFSLLGSDGDDAFGCVSCFISGDNCNIVACDNRGNVQDGPTTGGWNENECEEKFGVGNCEYVPSSGGWTRK